MRTVFPFLFMIMILLGLAGNVRAQFSLDRLDPKKMVEGAVKVAKGATGIGINEEMSIGGSVAVEIVAMNGGIWKDEAATFRLNLIGKALSRYSDRPGLTYRFAILNSEDINGFSAPGGYVFITKGAYLVAENDDQLAGVLAHEIAHVTRRHALKIMSRTEMMSGLSDVASGTASDYTQYDLSVDKVSETMLKTGYDPASEFDADRTGRELAADTGYDRDGLLKFLEKLHSAKPEKGKLFSTHPDLEDRIKKLGGVLATSPVAGTPEVQVTSP